ncbi:complement factor H [Sceloporus undulatus]|uniref:complement factor H n=1 Tax=Sceloporus undulatus TaxID=8520 RepID=UPI001C4D458C|nr:complement factor H [Sceloporus undulatus]
MRYTLQGSTALLLLCVLCTAQKVQNGCGPPPRRDREELSDLSVKDSYSHDEQVLYNCRPGYIKVGRFRMRCNNGRWEQMPPFIECRRKPCGNPGDLQYGSFELVEGEDFSFGARVVYQCDEGYKMLSHTNYRECRADGWSNAVPHCEITKCYPVTEPKNGKILMTGIMDLDQDFLYGHLLRFECNENFKIKGSNQIVCTSDGNWSEDVPTCIEITCEADSIAHGSIRTSKTIYKNGERIQIDCKVGYKPADRDEATCTRDGWNTRLECIEIVCSPPQILNGNFEPEQLQYEYQESIDILCEDGYKSSGTSVCTARGWHPPPTCILNLCGYPRIQNGRLYYDEPETQFPKRVNDWLYFRCNSGFLTADKKEWQSITCTKNGWNPKPKCFKKCIPQQIQHGRLIYSWSTVFIEGDDISIRCDRGYYPENQQATVKCTKNGWLPTPRCIAPVEIPRGCKNVSPSNGFFNERRTEFSLKEYARYSCRSGYTTPNGSPEGETQCLETGWSPEPKCIKTCQKPFEENVVFETTQSVFLFKETLHYECKEGFQTMKETIDDRIQCTENGWDPKPLCLSIECDVPLLEHGNIHPRTEKYVNRDVVKFSCNKGYTRVGPDAAQCYHFGWSPQLPVCKEKVNSCQQPFNISNGIVIGDLIREYQHGEKVAYECDIGFAMTGSNTVECVDGEWTSLPSCTEEVKTCGRPPAILHGDPVSVDSNKYGHNDTVNYNCREKFFIVGTNPARCFHGEWQLPECTEKCRHPKDPLSEQFVNNTVVNYSCGPNVHQTKCVNGKWSPEPECKELCPLPPQLPNAINITEIRNYKNGEEVGFTCMEYFRLQGPPKITCEFDRWQTPPRCVDQRCGDPPPIENGQIENGTQRKYLPGETVTYHCQEGFKITGSPTARCENTEWSQLPTCKEIPCRKPPIIEHASYPKRIKNYYQPGETVNYECHDGFVAEGPLTLTCQRGEWSQPSTCEDATCREPPVVDNASIVEDRAEVYLPGQELHYQCYEGFEISGPDTIRCENKVWSESPTCEDIRCPPPPDILKGRINGHKKPNYLPGEKVRYRCLQGYSVVGSAEITCSKKRWTGAPQCRETGGQCQRPPSIENGDITEMSKSAYNSDEVVHYKCQRFYRMEGNPVVRCLNGHWSETPRCTVPCTASQEDMQRNNIMFRWSRDEKMYSEAGDQIEFTCRWPYGPAPSSPPFVVRCVNGTFKYPQCI